MKLGAISKVCRVLIDSYKDRGKGHSLLLRLGFAALLSTGMSMSAFPTSIQAHGGGLDSSGGHNCYVPQCAGEYHCHRPWMGCGGAVEPPRSYEPPPTLAIPRYTLPPFTYAPTPTNVPRTIAPYRSPPSLTPRNDASTSSSESEVPWGWITLGAGGLYFAYSVGKKNKS